MALHDNIGENDGIDSNEIPTDEVSYEPREVKASTPEERSDLQRIEDGDPEIEIESNEDEIDVSPHAVWKPKKEEHEVEVESSEEEVEEEKEEEVEEEEKTSDKEEEEESEEQEEEKEEKKPAPKKKKSLDPVQKRINKITREKYDAKREAERLAKKLADAEKKLVAVEFEKKKSALTMEKPKEDDFETEAEYYEALGRWGARMEIHEAQVPPIEEKEEVEEKEETPEEARNRIIAAGKENYPDFEELVLDDDLKISPLMVEATLDSDYAADIFYLLAKSPDRAAEIAKMRSPAGVAREIGRIEGEFLEDEVEEVVSHDPSEDDEIIEKSKKKPIKKKGTAPPPVKPLSGKKGKVKKDLEDMSLADYYEARGYTRDGFKKSRIPQ